MGTEFRLRDKPPEDGGRTQVRVEEEERLLERMQYNHDGRLAAGKQTQEQSWTGLGLAADSPKIKVGKGVSRE